MAKAKASNVVDLADFRPRKAPPQQAQREEAPWEAWPHSAWALWCLDQCANRPDIASMVTVWEIGFLKSLAEWARPVTAKQQRCLQGIALRIDRLISESGNPAA
jgi:hypothetical protein